MHTIRIGLAVSCLVIGTAGVGLAASPSSPPSGAASDGRIAYAFTPRDGGASHVFTMAPDGSDALQVTPFESGWGVWSPDGTHLAVPQPMGDGRTTTAIVDPDGSDLRTLPLPDGGTLSLGPSAWSPDGARIALEGWSEADPSFNGIHVLEVGQEAITRLTTVEDPWVHDIPLAFSPDGDSLLVVRLPASGDRGDLFLLRLDDRSMRRLNPEGQLVWFNPFTTTPASWSPDGASIAFVAFDGTSSTSAVYLVGTDGADPVQVSDQGSFATSAVFSPDGQWLLYDMAIGGSSFHDLFVVHPDGSDLHPITDRNTTGSGDCCAAWSPSGQRILFQNGSDSTSQLWTMAADGTDARQLTTEPGFHAYYSWSAAGD
jgi:Tol biopolymer transport system component